MLEKIIKKAHNKLIFSLYGILEMIIMILPFVVVGLGIFFLINDQKTAQAALEAGEEATTGGFGNGILWIVIGLLCFLISVRKLKDFFVNIKYAISPKKYPTYKNLLNEQIDLSMFDKELEDAQVLKKLNKKNPVLITENFIFGMSPVNFFVMHKNSILWTYEYNGNGIVFFDKNKFYGFTYFSDVDGNDILIDELKVSMPYLYFGTDFDYKTIMHEQFDQTVLVVENERNEFLNDPESYRIKKAEEERIRQEEAEKKLEEEKNKELAQIEENSQKQFGEETETDILDDQETVEATEENKEENE